MKIILRIARTELATLFYSPIAWFILIIFSFLTASSFVGSISSFLTHYDLNGYDPLANISLTDYLYLDPQNGFLAGIVYQLYIYIPLLTMGLLSRETASGSIKLLYSSPVTSTQIVLGKYFAAVGFGICMMLVPIASMFTGACTITHFDWCPVLVALLGIFLLICVSCAVGLYMSSLTSYQVVAAIGTLAILATLRFIGSVGQQYAAIRELTYWLSVNGRSTEMLMGQLRSDDLIYFLAVTTLFLAFTRFRIAFGRRTISRLRRTAAYAGVFAAVLIIGVVSSQPALVRVWDATRFGRQSITEQSCRTLAAVEGPVTITNYVNLLDNKSTSYLPNRLMQNRRLFIPYRVRKSDLEERYFFYYDSVPQLVTHPRFSGKTLDEARDLMAIIYDLDPRVFHTPEEVRAQVDLRDVQSAFTRVVATADGRSIRLPDFEDDRQVPSEAEIIAAFKRLTVGAVTVGFLTGHGERQAGNPSDRGYSRFAVETYNRTALVNQGFEIRELNLADGAEVPDGIDIVVIADMKRPLAAAEQASIGRYTDRGGNLLVLTDPEDRDVMNPLLAGFGLAMEPHRLVQPFGDFDPELVLSAVTDEAAELGDSFRAGLQQGRLRISMPGCAALSTLDNGTGFRHIPVLRTQDSGAWIECEEPAFEGAPVVCNPAAGEREQRYITAYAAEREVNGRTQRILVTGDADCFANNELASQREGYSPGNQKLILESFRYLTGGEFPVDVRRPHTLDSRFSVSSDAATPLTVLFKIILPGLLLLTGIGIWLVRRRN